MNKYIKELKKLTNELTEAISKVADLSSDDDKKTIEKAWKVLNEVKASEGNLNEAVLVELYKKVQTSRNSIVNLSTRVFSGKRDVRNGNEIPKTDGFRADGTVSESALYGRLSFLDSNGNSKNVNEDTVPVVSNGDGKRFLQLRLDF